MKTDPYGEKGNRKGKRDRYWSVMLVGDHGRIIPFRRFKGLAIGAACLLVMSILALVIVSLLFVQQKKEIAQLGSEVQSLRQQANVLKDEKDLYLTQLAIVKQEKVSTPARKKAPPKKAQAPRPAEEPSKSAAAKTPVEKKKVAPKPAPVKVKWAADIRRFKTTYSPDRKILKSEFRIYNTSKPKKPLSGHTVVVFKNLDEVPIHWFSVPTVQLKNGEPIGDKGQAFKINNYRTVQFRAYGQKAPVKFNTATVFIYSDKGQLLVSKDFGFKITYKPPPVIAKPPAPKAVKTNASDSAPVPNTGGPASTPVVNPPAGSKAPAEKSKASSAPAGTGTVEKAIDAVGADIAIPEASSPVPDKKLPAGQTNDSTAPAGAAPSTPPIDMPEPGLKPKSQGEPQ